MYVSVLLGLSPVHTSVKVMINVLTLPIDWYARIMGGSSWVNVGAWAANAFSKWNVESVFSAFSAISLKLPQSNCAKSPPCVSSFALCLWPERLMCFLSWQVYLINVTYSDNTSHIIYRRYSKFFDLQVIIHQSQTVSPLYTVQVRLLLKAFACFAFVHSEPVNRYDCLYRLICKPGDFPCTCACIPPLDTFMNQCVG